MPWPIASHGGGHRRHLTHVFELAAGQHYYEDIGDDGQDGRLY